jgi:hypothetical protein
MKNWKEIIEKNEETIYAAITEANKEMFGLDRNFKTYIIIDEDGDVFREEAYGNTRNLYNKNTLIVATVNAWDLEDEDFESDNNNLINMLNDDDEAAKNVGQNAYEYYYNAYVDAYNNDDTDEEFNDWFENEYESLYEQYKNKYNEAVKEWKIDEFDAYTYDIYENI